MIVALGSDHGGYALKSAVADAIRSVGHDVLDCGATSLNPGDDYPDFTAAVARAVLDGKAERGVVVCGSGVGAAIAANKFAGIRASLCHDTFSARQGVEDDSMNVLALGARIIGPSLAEELVKAFLHATFSNAERHRRRLEKVIGFERNLGRER
jgi:ribose 5-phosphate isomerase B